MEIWLESWGTLAYDEIDITQDCVEALFLTAPQDPTPTPVELSTVPGTWLSSCRGK